MIHFIPGISKEDTYASISKSVLSQEQAFLKTPVSHCVLLSAVVVPKSPSLHIPVITGWQISGVYIQANIALPWSKIITDQSLHENCFLGFSND